MTMPRDLTKKVDSVKNNTFNDAPSIDQKKSLKLTNSNISKLASGGDWPCSGGIHELNSNMQSIGETDNYSHCDDMQSMQMASLPDLPIDFQDQKSIEMFLAKTTPLIKILFHVRKPIASYQEVKGVHPNSSMTFSALLQTLYNNTTAALYTMIMLIYNLMPLLDMGLFVLRFIIDKTIEIVDTDDRYDFYMKTFIFIFQVLFVSLLVLVLTSIVIFPILGVLSHIVLRAVHIIS